MRFHTISVNDGDWIREILSSSHILNCEFSLGNLFTWGWRAKQKIGRVCDCVVIQSEDGRFSIPVGARRDDALTCLLQMLPKDQPASFFAVQKEDIPWLESRLGQVKATFDRRWSDYVYLSERLSTLQGKKLAAKRNHINYFEQNNSWHTVPITAKNIKEVVAFSDKWCALYGCGQSKGLLQVESCMVRRTLENFEQLKLQGLILYAGDQMVAYSYGEQLSADCFVVHAEKALTEVRGAYPMINRCFVREFGENFQYINREDDTGDEGLRKAKLSYQPEKIVDKYRVEQVRTASL